MHIQTPNQSTVTTTDTNIFTQRVHVGNKFLHLSSAHQVSQTSAKDKRNSSVSEKPPETKLRTHICVFSQLSD
jgi:hypothetical protein